MAESATIDNGTDQQTGQTDIVTGAIRSGIDTKATEADSRDILNAAASYQNTKDRDPNVKRTEPGKDYARKSDDFEENTKGKDDAKEPGERQRSKALDTVLKGLGIDDDDAEEAEEKLLADFEKRAGQVGERRQESRREPSTDGEAPASRRNERDETEQPRRGESRQRVRDAVEAAGEGEYEDAKLGELSKAEFDRVIEHFEEPIKPLLRAHRAMEKRIKDMESRERKLDERMAEVNHRVAWASLHPILDRLGAPGDSEDGLSTSDTQSRSVIVQRAFQYQQSRISSGKKPLTLKQALALSVHSFEKKGSSSDDDDDVIESRSKGKKEDKDGVDADKIERIKRRNGQRDIGPSRPGAGGGLKDPGDEIMAAARSYFNQSRAR